MGEIKKIVLDTNIIISGFGWKGNPHRILEKIVEGKLHWIISEAQMDEIKRVIHYPHLKFTEKQKNDIITLINRAAITITIEKRLKIFQEDVSDNMLLDIALAAEAEYLISGDQHLIKIKTIGKTQILTPREFMVQIK